MTLIDIQNTIRKAVEENLNIEIEYEKSSGEYSVRKLSDVQYSDEFGTGFSHISAFCLMRNEERTFRIDRIKSIAIEDKDEEELTQSIIGKSINSSSKYQFNPNKKIFNLYGRNFNDI